MQIFDFSEFSDDVTKIFNAAQLEEVIINYEDGNSYKLMPVKKEAAPGKSPFEGIPRTKLNITTKEIVEILQECRSGVK
jgi:hypothetical protein